MVNWGGGHGSVVIGQCMLGEGTQFGDKTWGLIPEQEIFELCLDFCQKTVEV